MILIMVVQLSDIMNNPSSGFSFTRYTSKTPMRGFFTMKFCKQFHG